MCLFVCFGYLLYAQNSIDSLQKELQKADGVEEIKVLLALAEEYKFDSLPLSFQLSKKALEKSNFIDNNNLIADSYFQIALCYLIERDSANCFNYYHKAERLYKKEKLSEEYAKTIFIIGESFRQFDAYDSAKFYYQKTIEQARIIEIDNLRSKAYNGIGLINYSKGNFDTTIWFFNKSLEIDLKLDNKSKAASSYNNIGVVYKNLGKYDLALESHFKALKIRESINEEAGIAMSYSNIAHIYYYWEDNKRAIEYFNKALEIYIKVNDKRSIAQTSNNLGSVNIEMKNYKEAIKYYKEALTYFEQNNYKANLAATLYNIGLAYLGLDDSDQALDFHIKSLSIQKAIGNNEGIIISKNNIGNVYKYKGSYEKALRFYKQTLQLSLELNLKENLIDNYKATSEIYDSLQNFHKAYLYYKLYTQVKDSVFNDQSQSTIAELEKKYETEKKEQEIKLLNGEKQLQSIQLSWHKNIIIGITIILILFVYIIIQGFFQFRRKKRINTILFKQNEEIKIQNDKIATANKNITDSIQYARRIQTALLPPSNVFQDYFKESFLINLPKDIVSGDFYWIAKKDNHLLFTIADCTGHGVPGAFMSSMSIAFLNDISGNRNDLKPNEILDELRIKLKKALHQTGKRNEAKDGIDLVFLDIDLETNILNFSGANNYFLLYRNNIITQYRGDKMPIGISLKNEKPFTSQQIKLEKGDVLYLFSDGYIDQFHGISFKKLKAKNFKNLIIENAHLSLAEQKEVFVDFLNEWKGESEQIDDILMAAIKI